MKYGGIGKLVLRMPRNFWLTQGNFHTDTFSALNRNGSDDVEVWRMCARGVIWENAYEEVKGDQ